MSRDTQPLPLVLLLESKDLVRPLEAEGLDVVVHASLESGLLEARRQPPRACVLGGRLAGRGVGEAVGTLRRALPFTDVLVWEGDMGPRRVREALRAGAVDVLLDDDARAAAATVAQVVSSQTLLPRVLEEEDRDGHSWRFEDLVSRSQRMWDVFETCIRTAATDASVLILGETGTGKELVARAIHKRSGRSGRFVALNCGAVPETLIDSELFGHVEGAFTGAVGPKEGLFRHADGGTLFLDEIGNLPLSAQYRLLRALQESRIRPVGGHEEIEVDIRVIAATSTPIAQAVEEEAFREDLLYRIDVIRLIIPPLRERPEDILFLFGHFVRKLADHYSLQRPEITEGFLDELLAYDWPGNVRELENFAERLLLTHAGGHLRPASFRRLMRDYEGREPQNGSSSEGEAPHRVPEGLRGAVVDIQRPLGVLLDEAVASVERAYLEAALEANEGRVQHTADQAGISRRTLLRKLKAHGIDKRDFKTSS